METIGKLYSGIFLLLALTLLGGCSHSGTIKNMREITGENLAASPEPDKSVIIFMRPESKGYAIQSSVFEIKDETPALVGIVAAKAKLAYRLDPGSHLFMVIGESADFMYADLAPNITYYVRVEPRMGWWKARFSLDPLHIEKLPSSELKDGLEDCRWVETNDASFQWARENTPSIMEKYHEYYPKWMSKDASERPSLKPADGL